MSLSTRIEHDDGHITWENEKGERHRVDGPAYEGRTGSKSWWINGELHREDGPAYEGKEGHKAWYINGQRHREDGPAIEYTNGSKEWYVYDHHHREDGPAMEWVNGFKAWFLNGENVTRLDVNKLQREKLSPIAKLVFTFYTSSVVHYCRVLLPLILEETYK
jgi:hypothetical protein